MTVPTKETIYDVITRIGNVIDGQSDAPSRRTVELDVADVERLMHAAVWGDD